jgi:hypothetical protein
MKKTPNLFDWATSELSQDAFICWLLSWANNIENKALFDTAKRLILELTNNEVYDFKKVKIIKQLYNIDILCVVDDDRVILIEDKTNTKNHSNQLEKYLNKLKKDYHRDKIFPVYLKTGDQSDFYSIKKAGYKLFLRSDFLKLLDYGVQQGVNNSIYLDFNDYLTRIEKSVQSYRLLPVNKWHWDSWKGFYSELQKKLKDGNWDYVPQKNGGFLGYWWYWKRSKYNDTEYEYYLQLEHEKFCFKLYPFKRDEARQIRDYYRNKLYPKAKEHGIKIYQNGRIGKWMTVAALRNPYIQTDSDGMLDMEKTIMMIEKIQRMIDDIE